MAPELKCDRCGKGVSISEGGYVFHQDKMLFICDGCAQKFEEEVNRTRRICSAVNENKTEAEHITQDEDAFAAFLKNIEAVLKKVPGVGNLLSDVPLLVSLVKSYVQGEYKEIPYNSIVAIVATLLYVISPVDLIPDVIPVIGFADDAAAVAFCMKMIHDDLEKYKAWRGLSHVED